MSYTIANLEGFEGQKIEAKISFWTGPRLIVNGIPAPSGARRGELLLQRNDGRQVTATWTTQLLGMDVPQLVVDGKTIQLAPPLKWYQWVWSALPILLVFWGGLLGGIMGVIAFSINTSVFRSQSNAVLKFVITAVVSILAVLIYLVIGSALYLAING